MSSQDFIRQSDGLDSSARNVGSLWRTIHTDPPLLVGISLLCAFGLFVLYSASGGDVPVVQRQAMTMVVGLVMMFIVSQFNVHFFRQWAPTLYAGGIGLLGLVLLIGVEENGAKSWLGPAWPAQLSALRVDEVRRADAASLVSREPPAAAAVQAPVLLGGLDSAARGVDHRAERHRYGDYGHHERSVRRIARGIRWRIVIGGFIALLLVSPAWYLFLAQEHQKNRILTFLNPYRDPTGAGYNIIQSQIAIGSGGIYGKGYGEGAQSHLDFIPESNTDFILAVLAEEFGLLGVLFLIALYLFVLARGGYIAFAASDMFSRLLAGSITLTFFFYVFVNMAMVSGLLPVIGLPLPLMSRGGTSVVTLFIGFGLLMSIQTHGRSRAL